MVRVKGRASYGAMKQKLLNDLSRIRNIRDSKVAKKRLRQYRLEAKSLHNVVKEINNIPMYLEKVVIFI